jgi:hypothetical protein
VTDVDCDAAGLSAQCKAALASWHLCVVSFDVVEQVEMGCFCRQIWTICLLLLTMPMFVFTATAGVAFQTLLANLATTTTVKLKPLTGELIPRFCLMHGFTCAFRFVASKSDFLVLVAAGNDGASSLDRTVTVVTFKYRVWNVVHCCVCRSAPLPRAKTALLSELLRSIQTN